MFYLRLLLGIPLFKLSKVRPQSVHLLVFLRELAAYFGVELLLVHVDLLLPLLTLFSQACLQLLLFLLIEVLELCEALL